MMLVSLAVLGAGSEELGPLGEWGVRSEELGSSS
jgi:hypothetical protein